MPIVPGGAIEGFARATARGAAWVEEHSAAAGRVHLDVGGEGRYPGAINLNPLVTSRPSTSWVADTGSLHVDWVPIPRLVRGSGEAMPIADHSVDVLTIESAPIRKQTAAEVARVLAPGGEVFLLNPSDYADAGAHQSVIDAIRGATVERFHDADGMTITHVVAPPA